MLILGGQAQAASVIITGSASNDTTGVTAQPQDPNGNSVFIGDGAGDGLTTTSGLNTIVGTNAGASLNGRLNTAYGANSGNSLTGDNNTTLGYTAGSGLAGGFNLVAGTNTGNSLTGDSNTVLGDNSGNYLVGDTNVAIGFNANSGNWVATQNVSNTIAIGTVAKANTDGTIAIGLGATTTGSNGTSLGNSSTVDGAGGTALGTNALAKTNDTAIGYNARANADGAVVIGANSSTSSLNSVAVGADASIATGADGSMALGQNAQAQTGATGAVALGQNSIATEANTVSIGSSTLQRRITNVAAGVNATDAVNVSQLNALDVDPHLTINASDSLGLGHTSQVGTTSNSVALGEGSVASEDNTVSVGSTTQQRRITNLADGVADSDAVTMRQLNGIDLDPNITTNTANSIGLGVGADLQGGVSDSVALGVNSQVQSGASNSVALGQGSVASEANTVSVGSATQQRRITNLADGVAASDASTVGQLNALDSRLSGRINDLDLRMDSVGAMAAAMSSTHAAPQAMGDTQLAVGVGNYNGSNAIAASLFHYMDGRTLLSAGVSKASNSNPAVSVGATFAW
ncbi:MAG: YadA-like family protein [Sedimenticola sp.]